MPSLTLAGGFTMVEAIIAISILGIVGAMVATFIKMPVQGYVSSAGRAELTDIADTALHRISRDLHLAVPNSVRVTKVGATTYLEFLQVRTGGVYRAQCSTTACTNEDPLDFDVAAGDSFFDVLGGFDVQPAARQRVVIFNLGVPGADAYNGDNTAEINSITVNGNRTTLGIQAMQFPFTSPSQSFQVIESPVTYVCAPASSGNTGTGTLTRVSGYGINAAQPTDFTEMIGITSAVLANRVSGCTVTPPENMNMPGFALVTIRLTLQSSDESISLYHEAHINNVP